MATGNVNTKSQLKNIRIPHDVIEGIELIKKDGESMAGFIVTAARNEIARRQLDGSAESNLFSARDALARVEEIGTKAGEEIRQLVDVARSELQRRKTEE